VLVLSVTEFRRFLREYPQAKEVIDSMAETRNRANAAGGAAVK